MSGTIASGFPEHFASVALERDKRLVRSTTRNQHAVAEHQRRCGVRPDDLAAIEFFQKLTLPEDLPGHAFERIQVKLSAENIDAILRKHGRGPRAVAPVIA